MACTSPNMTASGTGIAKPDALASAEGNALEACQQQECSGFNRNSVDYEWIIHLLLWKATVYGVCTPGGGGGEGGSTPE